MSYERVFDEQSHGGLERAPESGIELTDAYAADKEVVQASTGLIPYKDYENHHEALGAPPAQHTSRAGRKRWIIIAAIIAAVVVLAIALGVGLGVGLSHNKSSSGDNSGTSTSPSTSTSTSSSPSSTSGAAQPISTVPSTKGAFSGTGLTAVSGGSQADIVLIYQIFKGELRYIPFLNGTWGFSASMNITDIAEGSAITNVYTFLDAPSQTILYYVNKDGILADASWFYQFPNNVTAGNLADSQFAAPTSPQIAMQASIDGHWAITGSNSSSGGIRLWAGASDGSLHEYANDYATGVWAGSTTIPLANGDGGLTYSPGVFENPMQNSSSLICVNSQDQLIYVYQNTGPELDVWQTGAWTTINSTLGNQGITVAPGTGLHIGSIYTDPRIYYVAASDNGLYVIQFSSLGPNAVFDKPVSKNFTVMSGSAMVGINVNNALHLFVQPNGSTIAHLEQSDTGLKFIEYVPI